MPKDAKISELTVSRTQILDYLNCGYRWDLSYRRGIASTKVREKMDLGSAVHRAIKHGIAAYVALGQKGKTIASWNPKIAATATAAGAREWSKEEVETRGKFLTEEMAIQIRALEEEGIAIARRALEHFRLEEWEVATWKGQPLFEVEMIVPLKPWKGYRVIPDLVARPRHEGRRAPFWLIDWKSRDSFESDDAEEINLQFATIQYVMAQVAPDIYVDGSILWQVKSTAPKWPKTNKDGSMSRALIATDWETYSRALREARLNPADYEEDMKPKLGAIEWFRAIKQHRTIRECRAVWREIVVPAATRMATNPQIIRRWVHQPFGCSGCWSRDFCMAELRGDDTEFLLSTDYMDTRNPRKSMEMGENRKKFELI